MLGKEYGDDDDDEEEVGTRVWKYLFKGTRNLSVSCWKCSRSASLPAGSTPYQLLYVTQRNIPSNFPSATRPSNLFSNARSFNTPRCRLEIKPSGESSLGLDRPFGFRLGCLSAIEITFGQ